MSSPAQEAGPANDMGELLDSMEPMKQLRRGDVVAGVVMRADPDGIFVNIGHKAEGVVPPGEMKTLDAESIEGLNVGEEILTFVVRPESAERAAILSIDKAVGEQAWLLLEKMLESGENVEGKIAGFNRGGAIVEVEGIQGFVPLSQLVSIPRNQIREAQEQRSTEEQRPPASDAAPSDTAPSDEAPSDAAPSDEAPSDAAPSDEAPSDAAPSDAAPSDEAPSDAAPSDAAPSDAAPSDAAPSDAAPSDETPSDAAPSDEASSDAASDETASGAAEGRSAVAAESRDEPSVLEDAIGKVLTLKVLEVSRGRNRAIFSERQVLQQSRDEQKARLIQELTEGETRHGKVTGISSFGAFVDLGGADGLIHISELSWSSVGKPEEVVSLGQELDVYVLRVDAENNKIALSLRRLQPEPWETINDRFSVNDIVDATITKLTNFGAFARVESSVEGLIHITELADRAVGHPREVVKEGDDVKLKIIRIEPERRRIGLSLRQALEELD